MRFVGLLVLVLLAGCGGTPTAQRSPTPTPSPPAMETRSTPRPPVMHPPHRTAKPSSPPSSLPSARESDPRWRFYVRDTHRYASRWYAGRHRLMIGFGCTPAPYYDHDPRCPGDEGFHHGIDVAMACGTRLFSGVDGTVLPADAPGAPGPAYGVHPFRIHSHLEGGDVDVLVGHARRVFVRAGQRVHRGQPIALSSDSGAPDGCHLHFEVRRHGTGLSGAISPAPWLRLRY